MRECSSHNKFYPDSSIRPKHLDEDVNLLEIKNWIINFRNYINQSYSDEVPEKGHFTQMRPLLDDSWATSLERKNPNEKDLDALCKLLLEGKNRLSKHQRGWNS